MNWSARLHHWIFITITKNSLTVIKKYVTDLTILKVIIAMNKLSTFLNEWSLRIFCAAIVYSLFIPVSLVVFCSIVVTSVLILLRVKIQFFVTTRGYNIRDVRNWLRSSSIKWITLEIESPLVRMRYRRWLGHITPSKSLTKNEVYVFGYNPRISLIVVHGSTNLSLLNLFLAVSCKSQVLNSGTSRMCVY